MHSFYAQSPGGLRIIFATHPDYRHPYYWSAFIQSGDWRRVNPQPASLSG